MLDFIVCSRAANQPQIELWLEKCDDGVLLKAAAVGKGTEWSILLVNSSGVISLCRGVPEGLGFKLDAKDQVQVVK